MRTWQHRGLAWNVQMAADRTCNLHDLAVLRVSISNECMVQVFPCISPLHFILDGFLFDLAVVLNAGHGHAANAIKRHLQHKHLTVAAAKECVASLPKAWSDLSPMAVQRQPEQVSAFPAHAKEHSAAVTISPCTRTKQVMQTHLLQQDIIVWEFK